MKAKFPVSLLAVAVVQRGPTPFTLFSLFSRLHEWLDTVNNYSML